MPEYIIIVSTEQEETILSLSEAISDSVLDFRIGNRTDPKYLPIDIERSATDEDGFNVLFQRVD